MTRVTIPLVSDLLMTEVMTGSSSSRQDLRSHVGSGSNSQDLYVASVISFIISVSANNLSEECRGRITDFVSPIDSLASLVRCF